MFSSILNFFDRDRLQIQSIPADKLRESVAALLVEAAVMDDCFDEMERKAIERLLRNGYDLTQIEAEQLLATAEQAKKESVHLFRFTQTIIDRLEPEQRVSIIEMLWETVYADGVLTAEEDALVRRIAGLIHVTDRERGDARLRVLKRLEKSGHRHT